MKFLKTCPMLITIVVCAIFITVISYVYMDTVYADYNEDYDPSKAPHFVIPLKAASDGVFPIMYSTVVEEPEPEPEPEPEAEEPQDSQEEPPIEEPEDEPKADVSANDGSEEETETEEEEKVYELTEVDPDYFNDALFIGDSRTVGLSEYCEDLDQRATFYSKVSLSIYQAMNKEFVQTDHGKITVEQALSENQFGKIYIMLGLNEIGTGTDEYFTDAYTEVINRIRELQPDAIIYIQGIMHVTESKSSSDKNFNNTNINRRNEALSQLADNQTVFYIDMNEAVDDENGNLMAELSFDGIHLKAASYQRWYDFLLQHAIVKD